jgi:HlyD family secretion protein
MGDGSGAAGGERPRGRGRPQTVYVLREGKPVAVRVITGLTDGTVTEIVGGELKEGDAVILGNGTAGAAAPSQQRRMGPPRIL